MRRKFIAAAASGVLALTMTAALPTIHAAAVSIWNDITPGTESVETFQYKDYADRYSDAYELYGYDAEALFNHYETVGKAEGRVGRFKKTAEEDDRHPYVWDADERWIRCRLWNFPRSRIGSIPVPSRRTCPTFVS